MENQLKELKLKAIILAGGKSSRMKSDKALLRVDNLTLIELISFQLLDTFQEIIVITNKQLRPKLTELFVDNRRVRVVEDIIVEKGPLGGLISAYEVIEDSFFFLTSCDSVFIDKKSIEMMLKYITDYDAVAVYIDDKYEPMQAFYSRNIKNKVIENIECNYLSMQRLLSEINTKKIEGIENTLTINHRTNINTEEEFNKLMPELLKLEKEILMKERGG